MGRAELIELNELKALLEEHHPILEDREKGLTAEIAETMPKVEHAVVSCIYAHANSKKSAVEAIKAHGFGLTDKSVPLPSLGVVITDSGMRMVEEAPDYSITMTGVDVDVMVNEFRSFIQSLVSLSDNQKKLGELVAELEDVRRKNNAIKHALLPEIHEKVHDILVKIDEEERDSMVQLKFFRA